MGEEILFDDMKVGDLLFFVYEEGKGVIYYVGLFVGGGKMFYFLKMGKLIEIFILKEIIYEKE